MHPITSKSTLACAAALSAAVTIGLAHAEEPDPQTDAKAQEETPSTKPAEQPSAPRGRIELRRQNTERGTPEESTKTTLRLEAILKGTVSRLRLDLPFPDEKTDFSGDPFQPRPGDIKLRAYFRPIQAGDTRLSTNVEVTFPTADPPELGSGKYQLSAALGSVPGAPDFTLADGRHQLRYEWSVRQTVSFAGDADRKDINTTKPELALRDTIGSPYWLKLTFKPTIDWIQDGKTGAVLEFEGGWNASRDWRFSLMGGASMWGEGVPGIYSRRLELVAGRAF
jgi:hypothetical protein